MNPRGEGRINYKPWSQSRGWFLWWLKPWIDVLTTTTTNNKNNDDDDDNNTYMSCGNLTCFVGKSISWWQNHLHMDVTGPFSIKIVILHVIVRWHVGKSVSKTSRPLLGIIGLTLVDETRNFATPPFWVLLRFISQFSINQFQAYYSI